MIDVIVLCNGRETSKAPMPFIPEKGDLLVLDGRTYVVQQRGIDAQNSKNMLPSSSAFINVSAFEGANG